MIFLLFKELSNRPDFGLLLLGFAVGIAGGIIFGFSIVSSIMKRK